jgi:hypothetical protein
MYSLTVSASVVVMLALGSSSSSIEVVMGPFAAQHTAWRLCNQQVVPAAAGEQLSI